MKGKIEISSMDNGEVRITIPVSNSDAVLTISGNADWADVLAGKIILAAKHAREMTGTPKSQRT